MRLAPAGLGYSSRKYFTRDDLPLEFGTKVKVIKGKEPNLSQEYTGVVRGYRTRQSGNYQEWEYRVMLWRTNQWWIPASHLEVVEEVQPIKTVKVEVGDLVEDAINGYKGVVFRVESQATKTYVHFRRTYSSWSGCDPRLGYPHRLNAKNVILLEKGYEMPEQNTELTLEEKVDMLFEHLGLEIVVKPSVVKLQKRKQTPPPTQKGKDDA